MSRLSNIQHVLAVVVIGLAALGSVAYWRSLETTHELAVSQTAVRNEQTALQASRAVDQVMDRVLDGFDLAVKQLRANWLVSPTHFDDAVRQVIAHYPGGAITHILVLDAQGYLVYSSATDNNWRYFGDRGYFAAQAGSRSDWLFISELLPGRLVRDWIIALGRPLIVDGKFAGQIVVSLRPDYLADTLAALQMNAGDHIEVFHADGGILGSSALRPNHNRRAAADAPYLQTAATSGVYRPAAANPAEASPHVVGWTRSRRWRLVSVVAIDETVGSQALAASYHDTQEQAATAISVIIALATGVAVLLLLGARQNARLQESRNRERDEAERYRYLLRTASDGIHVLDRRGHLKEASQSFLDMLGYTWAEASTLTVFDWDAQFSREELEAFLAGACNPALGEGPVFNQYRVRTRQRRRDGGVIDVEVNLSSVMLGGEPYLYASARDITQQAATERELRRSNAELEQFAYVVSHDLRQPLRAVISYLALLRRELGDKLNEDCETFIGFASDGAKRMDALIRGLLEYSRVGRLEKPFEDVPLNEVAADVLQGMSYAIADAGGAVTVADGLPTVRGDRGELMRLFENLLSNAQKYRAADRPLHIDIGCDDDGREWRVWVKDNGTGIDPKDHERVFGIFQRLVARDIEGTGIGLSVCRKIAEHHGGRVWVDSALGQGCAFTVAFPHGEKAAGEKTTGEKIAA